ncbi:hypothetical protein AVEN_38036-1 [Araneus ventricosus]|uniref:Uncharacterized protein n=1 Tax=Araneus ventricosus TaxID=182803 RepID=A0A4Y2KXZ5_ARAVE|nr:hypothetical protein AVEN_38036-1 [Araneus ventricosus]
MTAWKTLKEKWVKILFPVDESQKILHQPILLQGQLDAKEHVRFQILNNDCLEDFEGELGHNFISLGGKSENTPPANPSTVLNNDHSLRIKFATCCKETSLSYALP